MLIGQRFAPLRMSSIVHSPQIPLRFRYFGGIRDVSLPLSARRAWSSKNLLSWIVLVNNS